MLRKSTVRHANVAKKLGVDTKNTQMWVFQESVKHDIIASTKTQ